MKSEYRGITLLESSGLSICKAEASWAFLATLKHSSLQSIFLFFLASSERSTELPDLMSAICDARREVVRLEKLFSEQRLVV